MAKEKELYRDTLERVRAKADELYGVKILYTQKEAAVLMGCSCRTLARRGLHELITCEQLARAFS